MIIFTPLAGSGRSSYASPLAYVLQIDDVKILLDCGSSSWNANHGANDKAPYLQDYYSRLAAAAPTVDLVLFSHGDLAHMGLYAFAHARWNLKAPGYCALPVQAMGRMAVVEEVSSILAEEDPSKFGHPTQITNDVPKEPEAMQVDQSSPAVGSSVQPLPTLDEVQVAFDSLNTLRYSEPTHLAGKCQGLTITPFAAGHTIGGTIWKIRSPSSGTIVYAVDMNHMKERHLDGTILLRSSGGGVFEPLARPDVFITDADRTLVVTPRRKDRDTALLDAIGETLKSSHSVLMPCDASTRILELLVLLDQYWSFSKFKAIYPICLVSKTGQEMLAFVRSMLEWMGGAISREEVNEVEAKARKNKRRRDEEEDDEAIVGPVALRFKNVKFYTTAAAFSAAHPPSTPKLVLAVPSSLSHGSSRSLLAEFASTPGNMLILTAVGEIGSLTHYLFRLWQSNQSEGSQVGQGKVGMPVTPNQTLNIKVNSKVPLQGTELEEFLQRDRLAKEKEAVQRAALARSQRILEADEGDSDSDESNDDDDELAVDQALDDDDDDEDGGFHDATINAGDRSVRTGGALNWLDDDSGARQLSFDIYLKGNVAKTTSFFKTSTNQAQRFRMFPYTERKRRVDEYGETLDVGAWLRKGKALDEDAESEELKELKRKRAEAEAKKAAPEPPSKFITEDVELRLACRMLFVDLEGLNDGRAVKSIVPQVNPRKMIIVHASSEATDALLQSCASIRAMTQEIFTPSVGENVTIGHHTNTFAISLADSLLSSIKMSQLEDNDIAFVYGRVNAHANSSIPTLEPVGVSTRHTSSESPRAIDQSKRIVATLPRSTLIGDLRLTSLRAKLTSLGLSAEFAGEGMLICSGGGTGDFEQTVVVRKTGKGELFVEGSTGDIYFTVRKEVYGLHALVAAYT